MGGQLGQGSRSGFSNELGEVKGVKGQILCLAAGGVHSGAVTDQGVFMWGCNREGQL